MVNWFDVSYLREGSDIQKQVYRALVKSRVMSLLAPYGAVLVGTYPIGLNVEGSDLDILCSYDNEIDFIDYMKDTFCIHEGFELKTREIRNVQSVICRFNSEGFKFEVFGQPIPVKEQFAFRHMLIEHCILQERGEEFRKEIIMQKEKGLSTEEAFCLLFGIEGDPYFELLSY